MASLAGLLKVIEEIGVYPVFVVGNIQVGRFSSGYMVSFNDEFGVFKTVHVLGSDLEDLELVIDQNLDKEDRDSLKGIRVSDVRKRGKEALFGVEDSA